MTKMVSNLEDNRNFLIRSIKIEFHNHSEIEYCLKDLKLVTLRFKLHTSNIGIAKLLYISVKARLRITVMNKFQYFVLTIVASKNIIIIILEDSKIFYILPCVM